MVGRKLITGKNWFFGKKIKNRDGNGQCSFEKFSKIKNALTV